MIVRVSKHFRSRTKNSPTPLSYSHEPTVDVIDALPAEISLCHSISGSFATH